jgi:hypothetical protein
MSAIDTVDSVVTPQLVVSVTDSDNLMEVLSPDTTARSRRRQKKKSKPARIEPRLNVVREKSPFGEYLNIRQISVI